jgi:tetraacyldisaccharide 4'-kinase
VTRLAPNATWCECAHAASGLINAAGHWQPLDVLAGRRVAAFCAIGNPAGFRHTLAATGCEIVAWRAFPDHYVYKPFDLRALHRMAADSSAEMLLCTQKDLVKIQTNDLTGLPLWAVAIEIRFLAGQEAFERALERTARGAGLVFD